MWTLHDHLHYCGIWETNVLSIAHFILRKENDSKDMISNELAIIESYKIAQHKYKYILTARSYKQI